MVNMTDEQLARAFEYTSPGVKIKWDKDNIYIRSPGTKRGILSLIPLGKDYKTPKDWLLLSLFEAVVYDATRILRVTSDHASFCQCSGCLYWWAALPWEDEEALESLSSPFSTAILEDEKRLIDERQQMYNLWMTSDIYLKSQKESPQNGSSGPSKSP